MSTQLNGNNQKKKKKGGGLGAAIVFLLVFVLPRLRDALNSTDVRYQYYQFRRWLMRNGVDPELLPVIVIFIVVMIVIFICVGAAKKAMRDTEFRRTTANSSSGRTTAAAQRPDPRSRSFTAPEPSCIVCDHTGEDHFVRDKTQRIAQLDEWLKNGIIDRDEYRVLKDRYERDL